MAKRNKPKKAVKRGARASAPRRVKPVPDGFHSVTPYLTVQGAAAALEFYARAFGARELMRMPGPDGTSLAHAEMRIGDSIVMLSDAAPGTGTAAPPSLGAATGSLFVYVRDVDAAFKRAVDAGAKVAMPLTDMFWGDRFGRLVDPFGHHWGLATHTEDVPPRELAKRAQAAMAGTARPQ